VDRKARNGKAGNEGTGEQGNKGTRERGNEGTREQENGKPEANEMPANVGWHKAGFGFRLFVLTLPIGSRKAGSEKMGRRRS
jgi:hypothetical protein